MATVHAMEEVYGQQRIQQAVWTLVQEMSAQSQELQQLAGHTREQAYWFRTCAYAVRLVRQRMHQDMMDQESYTPGKPSVRRSRRFT